MDKWVDQYLDILKQRLGLTSDAELANEFGFGKSTFATWRRRGSIPDPALMRMSAQAGHDLFFTGDELVFALSTSQAAMLVRALYTYIVIKRREEIDLGDMQDGEFGDLMWWAGLRLPIENLLRPIVTEKVSATLKPAEVFNELVSEIDANRLASAADIIEIDRKRQSE